MIRHRAAALIPLAIASMIAGCGPSGPGPARLRVAAASDLQDAMPILVSAFRLHVKDVEIDATFGASGQLAEQIRQGAPFDVFLSADGRFVRRLADEGIVRAESVRPYARGSLVLVTDAKADVMVKGLADLDQPGIKFIAIANPETAPYGMAAKQALERAGVYEKLKPKLVQAGSVRQALQMVQSGNAEVGIVGRSIARSQGIRSVLLPLDVSDPIVQYLGVVARSGRPDDASAFVQFLLSEDGQGIMRDLGFARPPASEGDPPKGPR
jgi:molybdate transport system substrate-binding protein